MQRALAIACAAVALACVVGTRAHHVTIDVAGSEPARVTSVVMGSVHTCDTPCTLTIVPNTTPEITVSAPGYYPASFRLSPDALSRAVTSGAVEDPARLRVPLVER